MRIVYVITSVGIGGAERQTLTLAARMADLPETVAYSLPSRYAQVALEHSRESAARIALATCVAAGSDS